MQLLLKQVRIVDPTSTHHNQVKDVFINRGKIEAIRNQISGKSHVFQVAGACISPGWIDVGTFVGDPGFEEIETLTSASKAASNGGYTALAVLPNTNPSIQSKAEVEYVVHRAAPLITNIYPLGALTLGCKGKEMAELVDMHHAGAIAFTDGKHSVQDAGVLLRSLEYVKIFDGLVINQPATRGLSADGIIHEGAVSVSLGLRGLPDLSEVLMIKRDIDLLRYSDSALHIMNVSSEGGLSLIADAKKEGLQLTCSVAVQNLLETVDRTAGFDANFKVIPPLRSENDRKALLSALRDGTIDFVNSNHRPVNIEGKKLEFAYADFGISALETAFGMLLKASRKTKKLDGLVNALSINARKALGIPIPSIIRGGNAELTLFHPELNTRFETSTFASKSKNNPYLQQELPGHVLGVINKYQSLLFN
ncbi:MAG: dihydroorotase [Saprospiraceae bacterium]|nr:dihydroorotase [Saprospiraceae bacterium]